ncbi:MAG: thiamine pyrophosphate-dependent enzyme, partial [Planctomycetota bacterium]|jgi:pyruvate-ferredoxin/flavodoxin oxidoreductase
LLTRLAPQLGDELASALLESDTAEEGHIAAQRERVVVLKQRLNELNDDPTALGLLGLADDLVRKDVWIVGGDGWAYDIGFGGLDHVLASGRDVNVLVLDTEVYSNTGGQASKATPRAAVAKFAAGGKETGKKDLGMIAMAYGNVYVAQLAMGGGDAHTVRALCEAASWRGPSLLIAYSPCIAHGIDMRTQMTHQRDAVKSGYWPLYRYDPRLAQAGSHPFQLDCRKPSIPLTRFVEKEARFAMLGRADPARAKALLALAQQDITERFRLYQQTAGLERTLPMLSVAPASPVTTGPPVTTNKEGQS